MEIVHARPRGRARSPGRRAGGRARRRARASTDARGAVTRSPASRRRSRDLLRRHAADPTSNLESFKKSVTDFFKNGTTVRTKSFVRGVVEDRIAVRVRRAARRRACACAPGRRRGRASAARGGEHAALAERRLERVDRDVARRARAWRARRARAAPGSSTPPPTAPRVEREPARVVPGEAVGARDARHRLGDAPQRRLLAVAPAAGSPSAPGRRGAPGRARGSPVRSPCRSRSRTAPAFVAGHRRLERGRRERPVAERGRRVGRRQRERRADRAEDAGRPRHAEPDEVVERGPGRDRVALRARLARRRAHDAAAAAVDEHEPVEVARAGAPAEVPARVRGGDRGAERVAAEDDARGRRVRAARITRRRSCTATSIPHSRAGAVAASAGGVKCSAGALAAQPAEVVREQRVGAARRRRARGRAPSGPRTGSRAARPPRPASRAGGGRDRARAGRSSRAGRRAGFEYEHVACARGPDLDDADLVVARRTRRVVPVEGASARPPAREPP